MLKNLFITNIILKNAGSILSGFRNIVTDCQFYESSLEIRGRNNQVMNCLFDGGSIYLQDYPDSVKIINNDILNSLHGIRFLSDVKNTLIKGNRIYSTTIPSSTEYAINFNYGFHHENITIIDNDFTYRGQPNFIYGVIDHTHSTTVNLKIKNNVEYRIENSGNITLPAGQSSVLVYHGLDPSLNPNEIKVSITPRGNLGNCWVAEVTSNYFNITCSSSASTDTRIDWYAEI